MVTEPENTSEGAVTRPEAKISGPVILDTPVVANDCVIALAISFKSALTSVATIDAWGMNDAEANE